MSYDGHVVKQHFQRMELVADRLDAQGMLHPSPWRSKDVHKANLQATQQVMCAQYA